MQYAVVKKSNNEVVNVILLEEGSKWAPSAGHKVVPCGGAQVCIGGTFDGITAQPPKGPEKTLPEAKEGVLEDLAGLRWHKEVEGLEVMGIKVKTDRESQQKMFEARTMAKEDPSLLIPWKGVGGWTALNSEQLIALSDTVATHVLGLFDKERWHHDRVVALKTVEEVEEYDIEEGW